MAGPIVAALAAARSVPSLARVSRGVQPPVLNAVEKGLEKVAGPVFKPGTVGALTEIGRG